MPLLIFYVEGEYPQVHELTNGKITIGRNPDNDIRIKDTRVSAYHAALSQSTDGSYRLNDLDSHNGTSINGVSVSNTALKDGDRIKIGVIRGVFRDRIEEDKQPIKLGPAAAAASVKAKQTRLDSKGKTQKIEPLPHQAGDLEQYNQQAEEARRNSEEAIKKAAEAQKTWADWQTKVKEAKAELAKLKEQGAGSGEFQNERRQLESELDKLRQEVAKAKADLEESKKAAASIAASAAKTKEMESKTSKFMSRLKQHEMSRQELTQKIEACKGEVEKLNQAIDSKQKQITQTQLEAEEKNRELSELKVLIEKKQKEAQDHGRDIKELTELVRSKQKDVEERSSELEKLDELVGSKNQIVEEKEAELNRIVSEMEVRQKGIEDQKEEIAKLDQAIAAKEKELADFDQTIANKKKEIEDLAKSVEAKQQEADERRRELDASVEAKQNEADERHRELDASLEAKQNEVSKISQTVIENQSLVSEARDQLAKVESEHQKYLADLSGWDQKRGALEAKCLSLTRLIADKSAALRRAESHLEARKTGGHIKDDCPPLRVIDPGLRSLLHYFHQGANNPDPKRVLPLGFGGLAACTNGSMHRDADSVFDGTEPMLLLMSGDLEKDTTLLESVAGIAPDRILLVSWPEGCLPKLLDQLGKDAARLKALLARVSGIVSVDAESAQLVEKLNLEKPQLGLPLPYPLDNPDWSYGIPVEQRDRGIFLSLDGFSSASPLHQARVQLVTRLAAESQSTVTLFRHQSEGESPQLDIPGDLVAEAGAPSDYFDYLKQVARHRLVTGFGRNFAGGELMGDALLTRAYFIGADRNDHLEEHLFPECSLKDGDISTALENGARLLSDEESYRTNVESSQDLADQHISFETVRERLNEFFHTLRG